MLRSRCSNTDDEDGMPEHHYLSRCYLRGFCSDGEHRLWAKDLTGRPGKAAPKNLCHAEDFYAVPHDWVARPVDEIEQHFGLFESAVGPYLQRALTGHIKPDIADRHALVALAAMNFARVPARRDRMKSLFLAKVERFASTLNAAAPPSVRPFPVTGYTINTNTDIGVMLKCLSAAMNTFDGLGVLVEYLDTSCVLTGDDPVLFSHTEIADVFMQEAADGRTAEVIVPDNFNVVMPLNRRAVVVFTKSLPRGIYCTSGDPALAHKYNVAVAAQSNQILAHSLDLIASVYEM